MSELQTDIVTIIQNSETFYVIDEQSKHIFEEKMRLPFYSFGIEQKDCITSMLKTAKVKVKLIQAEGLIRTSIKPHLEEWIGHQPFKNPIKKKYEVSKDLKFIKFSHLGPTAKTIAQKVMAVEKCQESIHVFLLKVWEELETHFYQIKILDSTVETNKHRLGTVINIFYQIVYTKDTVDCEGSIEEDE